MDSTIDAQSGANCTLSALESEMFEVESNKNGWFDRNGETKIVKALLEKLNDGGCRVFVWTLRTYFVDCGYELILLDC